MEDRERAPVWERGGAALSIHQSEGGHGGCREAFPGTGGGRVGKESMAGSLGMSGAQNLIWGQKESPCERGACRLHAGPHGDLLGENPFPES